MKLHPMLKRYKMAYRGPSKYSSVASGITFPRQDCILAFFATLNTPWDQMTRVILASFLTGDHYHLLLSLLSCKEDPFVQGSKGSGSQNCLSGLTAKGGGGGAGKRYSSKTNCHSTSQISILN